MCPMHTKDTYVYIYVNMCACTHALCMQNISMYIYIKYICMYICLLHTKPEANPCPPWMTPVLGVGCRGCPYLQRCAPFHHLTFWHTLPRASLFPGGRPRLCQDPSRRPTSVTSRRPLKIPGLSSNPQVLGTRACLETGLLPTSLVTMPS